jgi:hypothetical protein
MIGLALLLPTALGQAAPIRVTTWDLNPSAVGSTNGGSNNSQPSLIHDAAESLKKLHPDVIMLQQVADWDTCHQLIEALLPAIYQVVICSSFSDPRAKLLSRQVAILSKAKAYLAWSEPWQQNSPSPAAPGGFAFAAIRLGNKNIGIFSVQFSDSDATEQGHSLAAAGQQAREESARQLLHQIASLQDWKNNRLQGFIVAGDFNATPDDSRLVHEKTLSLLEQSGFEDAFAGLPLEKRVTLPGNVRRPGATMDYIFTQDVGLVGPAVATQSALCEHAAVTCEMDLALPKAAPVSPSLAARTESPPVQAATDSVIPTLASATTSASVRQRWLWLAGCLAAGLTLFVLVRKFARRFELANVPGSSPDVKAKTGTNIAIAHADQIIVAPPPESPPYVHIETEGSMQTQSQTWCPRTETGRMAPHMTATVRAGVIANLSRWLKQKAVQRLVSDRERLLATQQIAGLKVLAVDQRLAKIEHQIQQINQAYEQRIDDLLKELIATKEENRELIRAKIALVKAEMAKARLKAGSHAREHQQY